MADSDQIVAYYKQQFAEIYHLDTLDWRVALILFPTFGGFFGVLGYLNVLSATSHELLTLGFGAFRAFSWFLAFLAFYGMWSVSRNYVWLTIRTRLIKKIEEKMKVSEIWNAVVKESKLSLITSRKIPLFFIYSLLFYFSLTVAFANSIADWEAINFMGFLLSISVSVICIVINWGYLKSTLKE